LLAFCLLCIYAQAPAPPPGPTPVPPRSWPSKFWTWVITTIKNVDDNNTMVHARGQFLVYDPEHQYTARYAEEDLINTSKTRGNDFCDYKKREQYYVRNAEVKDPVCTSETPLEGPLPLVSWPSDFLDKARYLGTNRVAQHYCDQFSAHGVSAAGQSVQIDAWFTNDTLQLPCQIYSFEIGSSYHVNWAFDAFTPSIPMKKATNSTRARLFCAERDYSCDAKANAEPDRLGMGLRAACLPSLLDCDSLNPGGENYLPNDLLHHCNWAFNASFQQNKYALGEGACDFGGVAEMVPPKKKVPRILQSIKKRDLGFPLNPVNWLLSDIVCP